MRADKSRPAFPGCRRPTRARRSRSGFTIFEVIIAITIATLLMAGAVELFVTTLRTTTRTSADLWANADAANGLQHVINDAREALYFTLPDDTTPFTNIGAAYGFTAAQFETTQNGEDVDTGLQLTFPATATITINNSSGAAVSPAPVAYQRGVTGVNSLLIYRADLPAAGASTPATPDPTAGNCLWAVGIENGTAVNYAITKSIDTGSAYAVQFVRPTNASNNYQQYQLDIKIVSGYYSPINGVQTNEETNGNNVSQLTGKCVLMRDHEIGAAHDPTAIANTGSTLGNRWMTN